MENKKEINIRNKSGISAYDKEYYKNYAKEKTKQKIKCSVCDIEISYYAFSKHRMSIKHIKNFCKIKDYNEFDKMIMEIRNSE